MMQRSVFWQVVTGLAGVVLAVWLIPASLAGQGEAEGEGNYTPGKTSWGDPDLQGIWTTWDETPVQAPEGPQRPEGEGLGSGMSRIHSSPVSKRRLALVVDPPTGRIPVIESRMRRVTARDLQDTWETHSAWQRCTSRGVPGRLLQGGTGGYNKGYQILQIPGYVVIFMEEIHEMRAIPLDGRPHVGAGLRLWSGDSRGRWDGNTLIVDTTNFNGKGDGLGGVRQTDAQHIVERFTRVAHETMRYDVTIEDPNVYTRPWSAMQPHNLDMKYVIFEYACHEGNTRYMENTLRQGRLRDAEEAAARGR